MASKVLRARSESFTDSSDTSYASESNDSSEASVTATESSEADTTSSSVSKAKPIANNHIKKESTTSGGSTGTNSEASDPLESDFTDEESEEIEEEEEEATESEEDDESSEEAEEEAEEEEEEESEDETDVSDGGNLTNGQVKKKDGYDMDDFDILKTIGKCNMHAFVLHISIRCYWYGKITFAPTLTPSPNQVSTCTFTVRKTFSCHHCC